MIALDGLSLDPGAQRLIMDVEHWPIKCATRWVYVHIYAEQSERSSTDFLRRLKRAAPMKIDKLLTDNGSPSSDRCTSKAKQASGQHAFDRKCVLLNIEHRLIKPCIRTPTACNGPGTSATYCTGQHTLPLTRGSAKQIERYVKLLQ